MIVDEDLKQASKVLHYEDEEDNYVGMWLRIMQGNYATPEYATLNRIFVREDGQPFGTVHNDSLFGTIQYEEQYVSVKTENLTANNIAENLLSQVDKESS